MPQDPNGFQLLIRHKVYFKCITIKIINKALVEINVC